MRAEAAAIIERIDFAVLPCLPITLPKSLSATWSFKTLPFSFSPSSICTWSGNSTIDVTNQLITYNKVKRPSIGISCKDITESMAKQYNLVVGVYVASVDDFSAAEKAGLKVGDVITEIDGKKITNFNELNEIKNTHSIGDNITLKINRNGEDKEISLTLGEQN